MKNNIHEDLKLLAVSIDDCKPDPDNARTGHDIGGISDSLEKYGQRKPIVVHRESGVIIAGNGTYKAALALGWQEIAAVKVEDDEKAAIGFAIADNRLGDASVFDAEKLHELFDIVSPDEIPGVDDSFLESIGYVEEDEAGQSETEHSIETGMDASADAYFFKIGYDPEEYAVLKETIERGGLDLQKLFKEAILSQ